jgi:hypothetical protein
MEVTYVYYWGSLVTVTLVLKEDSENENHDEPHNTAAS